MEIKLSYKSVEAHFLNLRLAGYYQIDLRSGTMYRLLHRFYMGFVLSLMLFYTMQQALKVYEVRENLGHVMGTMFLFLTHTDAIYKQILLWALQNDVEDLLDTMKGGLYNQGKKEHNYYLLKTIRVTKLLLYSNNALAVATCFLWFVYPVYLHIKGIQLDFTIWLPFDENQDPYFYITAVYSWITTTWLAFGNTTMDVMVSTLLAQAKTQLHILGYNLSIIIDECKEDHGSTSEHFSTLLHQRFKNILRHHEEIVRFTKNIENIFGNVLAYQFLIGGWIICTSVYRLIDIEIVSIEGFSMVTYIICMLFEIFIYCYFGSEVTQASIEVRDDAYSMNWFDIPVKNRRELIIFMERIKRPIRIMAGRIVPLSNDTFVSIVKSSYSFYALLRSTNE